MRFAAGLVGAVLIMAPGRAAALGDVVGPRVVGMAGALRAAATGDAGLQLNPSGMSLARSYIVGADYQYGARDAAHFAHASIVDSTSGYNLAGGLYYTFLHASPKALPKRIGHEAGLALAFPFGDRVFIGGTAKYLHIDELAKTRKMTLDAGLTLRPVPALTLGAAGYNLRKIDSPEAPRGVGYGLSLALGAVGLVAVDGVTRLPATTGDKARTSVMGGAEYTFSGRAGVRGGGGWDAVRENAYLSVGVSAVSEDGALDIGFRQDISGSGKETFIAAGFRLFVPTQ